MTRLRTLLPSNQRYRRTLWLIVAALFLLWTGHKGWRMFSLVTALQSDLRSLESVVSAELPREAVPAVGQHLSLARQHAADLRREAGPFLIFAPLAGWIPVYGPDLAAARPLLDTARDLTFAVDEAFAALSPLLSLPPSSDPLSARVVNHLVENRHALLAASAAAHRATVSWTKVEPDSLSPAMQRRVRRIPDLLPALTDGLDLTVSAPELLGASGLRQYLILAQNSDELRATGGFISGAGIVALDRGQIVDFALQDSYSIDNLAANPYPSPPWPLHDYMGADLWLFRDSNWSPDFPTSAQSALDLYELGQGIRPDGVIAFDQQALQAVLAAIGPVTVAGAPTQVSADNVVDYIRSAWAPEAGEGLTEEWWLQRKGFMGELGGSLLDKLQHDREHIDLSTLLEAVIRTLDEHHTLIYTTDPAAAELLARRGWDGALEPGGSDFLMIVDSNVGFNKANPNVNLSATYEIDLSDTTAPTAALRLTYKHRLDSGPACQQGADYGGGQYEDMMVRCYWDFVRVLVSKGSQLSDSTAPPVPPDWTLTGIGFSGEILQDSGSAGTEVLSALVVLPPGETRELEMKYRLPVEVLMRESKQVSYRLALAKQPGTNTTPLDVTVTLPPGASLVSSDPLPATTENPLTFSFDLVTDETLEIVFQP